MTVSFEELKPLSVSNNDLREYHDYRILHLCEVCGKRGIYTPSEGHKKGWDYAPYMYPFKVVSPRTCGKCGIKSTAWWAICVELKTFDELSERQRQTLIRISREPESIIANE